MPLPYPYPLSTHKTQPREVDNPSGLPYPHPSHKPPTATPRSTRHTEYVSGKEGKEMKRKESGEGGRGCKKHMRNNTCRTLKGINRLRTWECMRIQPQAPADPLAAKQANQHVGTTNMARQEGNPSMSKNATFTLGMPRETLRTLIMILHCQVTQGNAQPITQETLRLSRERYKQMPECHGCTCSSLFTKLNTFTCNLMTNLKTN